MQLGFSLYKKKMTNNATTQISLGEWFERKFATGVTNSGLAFKVKRAEMADMLSSGSVPIPLVNAMTSMDANDYPDEATTQDKLDIVTEKTKVARAFYEALVMAVLVEPKLGKYTDPTVGVVAIGDLDLQELQDIWSKASSGVAALETFREESETVAVVSQPSENV